VQRFEDDHIRMLSSTDNLASTCSLISSHYHFILRLVRLVDFCAITILQYDVDMMRVSRVLFFSSFSVWVKNTELLSLSEKERTELDSLIDKLYDDIDEG
jgi:hypothetical protein